MPVIRIRGLPQHAGCDIQAALTAVCVDVARVYGCRASRVWATWDEIRPGFYVEGADPAFAQPKSTHPPLVDIIAFEGKDDGQIAAVIEEISRSLSDSLGLNGNLFITYTEARSGRVYTGGHIRKTNG